MNSPTQSAAYWVSALKLLPHPEGGFYRRTYLSEDRLSHLPTRYSGSRAMGSSIYFLVSSASFSAFHRLRTDEVWHYYTGTSYLRLHMIESDGSYFFQDLGRNPDKGEVFQYCVPRGRWFAAEVGSPESFVLAGCTLAPAFDFADFELAKRQNLIAAFPQHEDLIRQLTRS